jgi:HlyD family secretion protein
MTQTKSQTLNRISRLWVAGFMQNTAFLALAVLITPGCLPPESRTPNSETGPNSSTLDRVTVGKPLKKTLQLFTEQPARVQPFEETPIVAKLAGYIESIAVDIGDRVKKDQALILLRAPEYKDQFIQKQGLVSQAEAAIKQAEATVVAAEAAANSIKANIAEAEARISKAEAEFARWDSESKRIQALAASGTVTSKLAEETLSQYRSAAASKDEALANLAAVNAKVNEAVANTLKARSDLEVAKAKLSVAQSELAQAETMLQYLDLKAPFDGVVTSRSVDIGHFAQPAGGNTSTPLMTIANVDKVRVFVSVPESEAGWIDAGYSDSQQGDSVRLSSPSLSQPIDTRVTRTSFQLNPQSRTLSVEIDVDNRKHQLLPGAFVTAKILLEQRQDTLVLPISAVIKATDKTYCCVVENGKIQHRPIELGLRVGDEVEITNGIAAEETIVLMRASSLQSGQTVEAIEKK